MRSNKVIALANCCLNQNTVLLDWERAPGAYPFTSLLIEKGIGIIQLPCPELLAKGIDRPPMTYEDYNTEKHRNLCKNLCDLPIKTIRAQVDGGVEFLGTIGIYGSPNCSISDKRGIFMEEYFKMLEINGLNTDYLEVPNNYISGDIIKEKDYEKVLLKFIEV